jgi:ribosomal protein L16 Arg81 hydroxylase
MSAEKAMADIFSPKSTDEFLDHYWDQRILHIQRDDPKHYEALITIGDLDKILSGVTLPFTNIDLAKDSASVPKEDYMTEGRLDIHEVLRKHGAGATIIIRALHKWHHPLQRLMAVLESFFLCQVQANVYLTPARNQSTPPHWDTHDLLVLQIYGTKLWKLFEGEYRYPLSDQRFRPGIDFVGKLDCELLLRPGDLLYLPRGIIHAPRADDYSIHVAIGIHAKTYSDLIESMLTKCSILNEGMRRSLPWFASGKCDANALSILQILLPLLNNKTLVSECVQAMREEGQRTNRPIALGHLENVAAIPSLNVESVLRRKEGLSPVLVSDSDGFQLMLGTSQISFEPRLEETAIFLKESERFAVREIPGNLSDEHKCSLAYTLVIDRMAFDLE